MWAITTVWIVLQCAINSVSVATDLRRHGIVFHAAEPWIWEVTGGLSALVLLWPVLAFDDFLRARVRHGAARLGAYLLASIVFSLAHVGTMVGLRHIVYRLCAWSYAFGPWPDGLVYEYRKDAFSFLLMIAGAAALRHLHSRRSGRPLATSVDRPDAVPPPPAAALPPTFLVRTTKGDLLVRASEVEWVEAQGNYVALHVGGEVRLLRHTLAEMAERLQSHGFVRTHRRSLVNRECIEAILAAGPGESGVRLKSGEVAPLSESRRPELVRVVLAT